MRSENTNEDQKNFNILNMKKIYGNSIDDSISDNSFNINKKNKIRNVNQIANVDSSRFYDESKLKSADLFKSIILNFCTSLGFLIFGYQTSVFNTVYKNISYLMQWNNDQTTLWITLCSSIFYIGGLIGGISAGKLASLEIFGRRGSIILYSLLDSIGNLIAIIGNSPTFIIGRFISGFAMCGFITVIPLYIRETLPVNSVGKGGMLYTLLLSFGILVVFCLGLILPEDINKLENSLWRIIITFPCILESINVIVFIFFYKYDTPKFYIVIKHVIDIDRAEKSLKLIYTDDKEMKIIINNLLNLRKFLNENSEKSKMKDLFSKKYFSRFLLCFILSLAQQFTAVNVFAFYSNLIFLKLEPHLHGVMIYSLYFSASEFISLFLMIFVIENVGRRILLLTGLSGIFMCLLIITIFHQFKIFWIQKYIMIIYYFFVGVSIDPLKIILKLF